MGFLPNDTNNIIIDAVLTDVGRQFLARNDGSFSIDKFSMADDEVDYTIIEKFGRTVGKEKIEKNTPITEANTNSRYAIRSRAISSGKTNVLFLPQLEVTPAFTQVRLNNINKKTEKLQFTQTANSGNGTVPIDLVMQIAEIKTDFRFLQIQGLRPDRINGNTATYFCTRDAGANAVTNATSVTKIFMIAPTITQSDFELFSLPSTPGSIRTFVEVKDLQGGGTFSLEFLIKQTNLK